MSSKSQKNWYLLSCKPQQDELAEQHLLNQNYEIYRPLAKRERKRGKKMIQRIESLFPRYIFIRLDRMEDNWAPIRSTRGVSSIVRFGLEPALVPEPIIQHLKQQEEKLSNKAIDLDRYKSGETVTIEVGPFKGLDAVFQSYDGEERVIVLLNILECQTKLKISPAEVSKAS